LPLELSFSFEYFDLDLNANVRESWVGSQNERYSYAPVRLWTLVKLTSSTTKW